MEFYLPKSVDVYVTNKFIKSQHDKSYSRERLVRDFNPAQKYTLYLNELTNKFDSSEQPQKKLEIVFEKDGKQYHFVYPDIEGFRFSLAQAIAPRLSFYIDKAKKLLPTQSNKLLEIKYRQSKLINILRNGTKEEDPIVCMFDKQENIEFEEFVKSATEKQLAKEKRADERKRRIEAFVTKFKTTAKKAKFSIVSVVMAQRSPIFKLEKEAVRAEKKSYKKSVRNARRTKNILSI